MEKRTGSGILRRLAHRVVVLLGASTLTCAFFLVLPLMQAITAPADDTLELQAVDTAALPPPPPPPPEEEPEEEPEPEPEPPKLADEAPPLDLAQLELALNPGFSDGWMSTEFALKLETIGGQGDQLDALFSLADLDQEPRAVFQPSPTMNAKLRKAAPGTVWLIFIVNELGRVESPKVQSASDPIFERPALDAIKKWKFEPGKRQGKPVSSRMRIPIIFPD